MNRRSFVQTLGAGAAGLAALELPIGSAAAQATAPAAKAAGMPAATGAIRIGSKRGRGIK